MIYKSSWRHSNANTPEQPRDFRELADEGAARVRSQEELRLLIEDEATGGLHLEMMGLVWLLAGTLVAW